MSLDKVLLLLALLVVADQAAAFTKTGHFAVANVAWNLISEQTKATVEEILGRSEPFYESLVRSPCDGECSPLGEIALWADSVRDDVVSYQEYGYTDLMHYIEIPDDEVFCPILADDDVNECWIDYSRDCPNDACSVGAINMYSKDLQQEHQGQRHLFWVGLNRLFFGDSAKESIMFLTHFIGDLHQPLHSCRRTDYCGDWIHVTFIDQDTYSSTDSWTQFICSLPIIGDLSGTLCTGKPLHLHKVWDRSIIKKTIADDFEGSRYALEQDLLQYIADSPSKRDEWLACPDATDQDCVMGWANHELELALRYAYRDVDGSEVREGTVLTEAYYERALPIMRQQLAAAAVRLAYTLDYVLA